MLSERICTRCKCNICVEGRYWSAGYCSHCGGKLSGVIASVGRFVNGVEMRFGWRAIVADDVEMLVVFLLDRLFEFVACLVIGFFAWAVLHGNL